MLRHEPQYERLRACQDPADCVAPRRGRHAQAPRRLSTRPAAHIGGFVAPRELAAQSRASLSPREADGAPEAWSLGAITRVWGGRTGQATDQAATSAIRIPRIAALVGDMASSNNVQHMGSQSRPDEPLYRLERRKRRY